MRFKARIGKENLIALHSVISSLERIGLRAALHLSPESIKISVIANAIDDPRCFCEVSSDKMFHDYRIESQSDNSILFEIGLDLLSIALKSGLSADICQLKLVKRGSKPCLCFEAQASHTATILDVKHDIPIRVQKASDIVYYQPPEVPPPDTALQLPRSKLLRTIIDKMARFGKSMKITSSQLGQLSFQIASYQSSVDIKTFVPNLTPIYTETMDRATYSNNVASVNVDINKLSAILRLHDLKWDNAVLYVTDNSTLFLELPYMDSGTIGFYVPIIMQGQDGME